MWFDLEYDKKAYQYKVSYRLSIDGIIYDPYYGVLAIPPRLKINNLYLPKEVNILYMNVFNTNSYIKNIHITNNKDSIAIYKVDVFEYSGNIIYKNKIIRKVDNQWKII